MHDGGPSQILKEFNCHFHPNHMAGASKSEMLGSLMSLMKDKIGEATING